MEEYIILILMSSISLANEMMCRQGNDNRIEHTTDFPWGKRSACAVRLISA